MSNGLDCATSSTTTVVTRSDYDPWDGKPAPLIGAAGGGATVTVTMTVNIFGDADPKKAEAIAAMIQDQIREAVGLEADRRAREDAECREAEAAATPRKRWRP